MGDRANAVRLSRFFSTLDSSHSCFKPALEHLAVSCAFIVFFRSGCFAGKRLEIVFRNAFGLCRSAYWLRNRVFHRIVEVDEKILTLLRFYASLYVGRLKEV